MEYNLKSGFKDIILTKEMGMQIFKLAQKCILLLANLSWSQSNMIMNIKTFLCSNIILVSDDVIMR